MPIWITRPGQPASRTTRFEPPPRIRTRSSVPSASCSSLVEVTRVNARAGPPIPRVVFGPSGTSASAIELGHAAEELLVLAGELVDLLGRERHATDLLGQLVPRGAQGRAARLVL